METRQGRAKETSAAGPARSCWQARRSGHLVSGSGLPSLWWKWEHLNRHQSTQLPEQLTRSCYSDNRELWRSAHCSLFHLSSAMPSLLFKRIGFWCWDPGWQCCEFRAKKISVLTFHIQYTPGALDMDRRQATMCILLLIVLLGNFASAAGSCFGSPFIRMCLFDHKLRAHGGIWVFDVPFFFPSVKFLWFFATVVKHDAFVTNVCVNLLAQTTTIAGKNTTTVHYALVSSARQSAGWTPNYLRAKNQVSRVISVQDRNWNTVVTAFIVYRGPTRKIVAWFLLSPWTAF